MTTSSARPPLSRDDLRVHTGEPWPLPGAGDTASRWSRLAHLARHDLPLAKLVEPHHDALAILAELGGPPPGRDEIWAVWAAAPPFVVLTAVPTADGWELSGRKAYCSGAALATRALVTAETADGSRLFAVDTSAPGLEPARGPAWVGAGMRRAETVGLSFTHVHAAPVGEPGAYTQRPGFWFGAIGIAACWVGGARGVAQTLEQSSSRSDPHTLAHLGAVRAAIDTAELALEAAAVRVDSGRMDVARAERLAQSLRAQAAETVRTVVDHVDRAIGPGPLAFDAAHAEHVDDLRVFVRQHHAEHDLERLGSLEAGRA